MNLPYYLEKYYWLFTEAPRLGAQLTETAFNIKEYENLEEGNNIPSLMIPGFSSSNSSTFFLRKVLNQQNHNLIKWCIPRNDGFSDETIEKSIDQVKELSDKFGAPINILGQSLGGCFARIIANTIPEYINFVVTLGTPITGLELVNPNSINQYNISVGMVDAAISHHDEYYDRFFPNPPVPSSSLYSKTDGIVNWRHSVIKETNIAENIEINASHFGMIFNLKTLKIVANRLAQDKKSWEKWSEITTSESD